MSCSSSAGVIYAVLRASKLINGQPLCRQGIFTSALLTGSEVDEQESRPCVRFECLWNPLQQMEETWTSHLLYYHFLLDFFKCFTKSFQVLLWIWQRPAGNEMPACSTKTECMRCTYTYLPPPYSANQAICTVKPYSTCNSHLWCLYRSWLLHPQARCSHDYQWACPLEWCGTAVFGNGQIAINIGGLVLAYAWVKKARFAFKCKLSSVVCKLFLKTTTIPFTYIFYRSQHWTHSTKGPRHVLFQLLRWHHRDTLDKTTDTQTNHLQTAITTFTHPHSLTHVTLYIFRYHRLSSTVYLWCLFLFPA